MLKEEILEILELFEKYEIPEESQRKLFEKGLHFDFTYGDPDPTNKNQTLTVFGVGILLKTCLENNIRINIKKLIEEPYMFQEEGLIKEVAKEQKRSYPKIKRLGK